MNGSTANLAVLLRNLALCAAVVVYLSAVATVLR